MIVASHTNSLKVADQCWVGLALLHIENPQRAGFTPEEILTRIQQDAGGVLRPGVRTHISAHNVANVRPNPGNYRMFFRQQDGTYRLFRPGDQAHPARRGRTKPDLASLPSDLRPLVDWYERTYCKLTRDGSAAEPRIDPVLGLLGLGKHLWKDECGDDFVKKERTDW